MQTCVKMSSVQLVTRLDFFDLFGLDDFNFFHFQNKLYQKFNMLTTDEHDHAELCYVSYGV
ncbi:hypothetical protein HanXRQr2_Chr02g0076501 [Helianthus annuus]|uniref:Uncharacterized protein n=2 Tax=Helianthus annuus TaxID=4232 RepID=A0A9K3P1W9_HELAN|nr:hypothetical protein HanXRQr2_Chr02g0076501 [Helianthus annuus]KAJ0952601.1 hypothetical protein HanPSC8_Chr02g0074211 [Helianthus annuus]